MFYQILLFLFLFLFLFYFYVQSDRPQNDLDVGCYKALDRNFNFLFCVVAQLVDWLPLMAMGLSVFRGEAPILISKMIQKLIQKLKLLCN